MPRTTATLVKGVLGDDYGPREDGTEPNLDPYIDSATVVVDRVNSCAATKGYTLSTTELEIIERWLAAHMYALSDKPIIRSVTADSSATYAGQTGLRLDFTSYGQNAKLLDPSGCLENVDRKKRASVVWLGKNPSDQIPYRDRR